MPAQKNLGNRPRGPPFTGWGYLEGQGDLVSRLILGIIRVTKRLIGVNITSANMHIHIRIHIYMGQYSARYCFRFFVILC